MGTLTRGPDGATDLHANLFARARDLVYRYRLQAPAGFEYVSPSAWAMTGYTPEDHYADPQLGFKMVHPDDRHLLEQVAAGDATAPLVLRWIRKDGRVLWTEQQNVTVRDAAGAIVAIEGVARDVTEREEALAQLRESELRYRSLVESLAEGVVMHDASGHVVMCNPAARRILGLTLDQMRGVTQKDPRWAAVHEDGTPHAISELPSNVTRQTGQPVRGHVIGVRRADGSRVWMLVNTQALRPDGGGLPCAVVVSFTDITAERGANDLLREALRTVRALSGMLPICAHCKKIRTDAGYWQSIEAYIHEHSNAQFSHGICPECLQIHYPLLSDDKE